MSGDSAWGAVSLLLRGDGANGSATIVDSSPVPKTLAAVGTAKISTAQAVFGGSSLYFDGAGYVSTPANNGFAIGSVDFTIESWVYPTNSSGGDLLFGNRYQNIIGQNVIGQSTNGTFSLNLMNLRPNVALFQNQNSNPGSITAASALAVNAWAHVAYCRAGNTCYLFVSGQLVGTAAISGAADTSTRILPVGADSSGACKFQGYIDDLRITKGIARYTANFTPPSAAFPGAPDDWVVGGRGIMQSVRPVSAPPLYSGARPIRPSLTRADGSAGPGSVLGTVKVDTLPVSRKVRLFDVASGRLLKETWSDKSGVYRFDGLALDRPYTVLSHDHLRDYNATVADYVYAEVLP